MYVVQRTFFLTRITIRINRATVYDGFVVSQVIIRVDLQFRSKFREQSCALWSAVAVEYFLVDQH